MELIYEVDADSQWLRSEAKKKTKTTKNEKQLYVYPTRITDTCVLCEEESVNGSQIEVKEL
jgi:hypothetical protein